MVHIIQSIDFKNIYFLNNIYFGYSVKTYIILIIFYCYLYLVINFFMMLKNIIRDLESLIFTFIQSKE